GRPVGEVDLGERDPGPVGALDVDLVPGRGRGHSSSPFAGMTRTGSDGRRRRRPLSPERAPVVRPAWHTPAASSPGTEHRDAVRVLTGEVRPAAEGSGFEVAERVWEPAR